MLSLTLAEISAALEKFEFPKVDLIVGIASGGTVPAALIARRLNCEMTVIKINFRDQENRPCREKPLLLLKPEIPAKAKQVLLVDDASVTGQTLETARAALAGFEKILTFVLKGKADYVLFPKIEECVAWPWGRPFNNETG